MPSTVLQEQDDCDNMVRSCRPSARNAMQCNTSDKEGGPGAKIWDTTTVNAMLICTKMLWLHRVRVTLTFITNTLSSESRIDGRSINLVFLRFLKTGSHAHLFDISTLFMDLAQT